MGLGTKACLHENTCALARTCVQEDPYQLQFNIEPIAVDAISLPVG
jgi:hypothetical protein